MSKWTTPLFVCLLAVVPVASANPISLSTLDLVGIAQLQSPNLLRLTPNTDTNDPDHPPAGAAWTPTALNVVDPFAVSFSFHMWDQIFAPDAQVDPFDGSGGDGLAFVIQTDPRGTAAIGRGAGGMGFMGIYDSVAVMFDTYQNLPAYGDPSGNYIGVNTRGTDFNVPHHVCVDGQLSADPVHFPDLPGVTCTGSPTLGMTLTPLPRLDGDVHTALIVYNPGTLAIYLDSGINPVLRVDLDLATLFPLQNGNSAYLGFTAGTRGSFQKQDILDFSFTEIPEPATATGLVAGLMFLGVLGWKRKRALVG